MKKTYNEPKEIVIELGMEGQLLQGIVSGGLSNELDTQPGENPDPEEGEEMENARTQSVWGEW